VKNILVTGHHGFIGPLLVKQLVEKGYAVKGIDTQYFGADCDFYPEAMEVEDIRKDMRLLDEANLEGVDAICHLAALSNDIMGDLSESATAAINHQASVRLAQLAKKVGVKKFIFSSSCSLYGIAGNDAVTEEASFAPMTAYARSKVAVEEEIFPLAEKNYCVTSLRNATAYGVSPKLRVDLVVNNLLGSAFAEGKIKIMSDGTPWRPLIHAEDIARAFVAVIEAPEDDVNRQAFNVGQNEENFRVKEIADVIGKVMPHCEIVFTGEHGADARSYRVSFDKIEKTLPNFKPAWTLSKGVEQLAENYERYHMDEEKFKGRYFIRLKQLKYLMENREIDNDMYWRTK
jgi:nucleoside-diphosphate-sugar epimerase